MKSKFFIFLAWTILPTFVELINPAELEENCRKFAMLGNDIDFLDEKNQQIQKELIDCQKMKDLSPMARKIVTKQIGRLNKWIEVIEKLNKMEEENKHLKKQFGECGKELNKGKEEFEGCRGELAKVWPWKVLAFVCLGIAATLVLFVIVAGAYYFYKLGSSQNLQIKSRMDAF